MVDSDSTSGKAPAFQFYPKDFLADENVRVMSLQERGAYITLLSLCWIEGTLPADLERLARLCGVPAAAFRRLWPALEPCFRPDSDRDGRLIHPRLEREREKQRDFNRRQSDNGRKGGRPRKTNPSESQKNPTLSSGLVQTKPTESSAFAVRSLQSPDSSQPTYGGRQTEARSRRPIFRSDRFVVFEWLLDDIRQLLGPHTEAFELDLWFDALSKRASEQGLLIAKEESQKWVYAQTVAEAKRRGLKLVAPDASVVEVESHGVWEWVAECKALHGGTCFDKLRHLERLEREKAS